MTRPSNSTRLRPDALARYSARSARASIEPPSTSWSPCSTTPKQQVIRRSSPAGAGMGSAASAARSPSATVRASAPPVSGRTTRNSSPPMRPTTSLARSRPRTTVPKLRRTRSPKAWPKRSLTSLKWSRSQMKRASGRL